MSPLNVPLYELATYQSRQTFSHQTRVESYVLSFRAVEKPPLRRNRTSTRATIVSQAAIKGDESLELVERFLRCLTTVASIRCFLSCPDYSPWELGADLLVQTCKKRAKRSDLKPSGGGEKKKRKREEKRKVKRKERDQPRTGDSFQLSSG